MSKTYQQAKNEENKNFWNNYSTISVRIDENRRFIEFKGILDVLRLSLEHFKSFETYIKPKIKELLKRHAQFDQIKPKALDFMIRYYPSNSLMNYSIVFYNPFRRT